MTTDTPVRPSAHRLSPPAAAPRHIDATPRLLAKVAALPNATLASMRYQSPLRYPGAKSGLASAISHLVKMASASIGRPHLFVEPFAGGASTALRLAGAGVVDRVLLADADPLVARFWQVAAANTDWLIDRMWSEPVTLERWDYWRSWTPTRADDCNVAMKCLFLNRTTFSGILHGRAGPIGGRQQTSQYAIDCRFNKQALEQRPGSSPIWIRPISRSRNGSTPTPSTQRVATLPRTPSLTHATHATGPKEPPTTAWPNTCGVAHSTAGSSPTTITPLSPRTPAYTQPAR